MGVSPCAWKEKENSTISYLVCSVTTDQRLLIIVSEIEIIIMFCLLNTTFVNFSLTLGAEMRKCVSNR